MDLHTPLRQDLSTSPNFWQMFLQIFKISLNEPISWFKTTHNYFSNLNLQLQWHQPKNLRSKKFLPRTLNTQLIVNSSNRDNLLCHLRMFIHVNLLLLPTFLLAMSLYWKNQPDYSSHRFYSRSSKSFSQQHATRGRYQRRKQLLVHWTWWPQWTINSKLCQTKNSRIFSRTLKWIETTFTVNQQTTQKYSFIANKEVQAKSRHNSITI
jgi:hypothetical protein